MISRKQHYIKEFKNKDQKGRDINRGVEDIKHIRDKYKRLGRRDQQPKDTVHILENSSVITSIKAQ